MEQQEIYNDQEEKQASAKDTKAEGEAMKEHVYIVKQIQPYTKVLHVCKSLAKAERLVERIIGAVYNHDDKTYKHNRGSFVIEKLEVL